MKIAVRHPQPHEYAAAAKFLFQRLPRHDMRERTKEFAASLTSGELSANGILLAELHGEPAGAILSSLQADKTAFVWPPEVREGAESDAIADALLQELCVQLDAQEAWLGQCVLEAHETEDRAILSRNGFRYLTDLEYLEKDVQDSPTAARDGALEFESYDPERNHARFVRMLEQTYLSTIDCPEISGVRSAEEAFYSHQLSGKFDPALWKLYRAGDQDIGVLLINALPLQQAWEITYLGVARDHRGRGYGRAMIDSGCLDAEKAGPRSILVAVDSRNHFAKTIYDAAGFVEFATRSVHVRVCPDRACAR